MKRPTHIYLIALIFAGICILGLYTGLYLMLRKEIRQTNESENRIAVLKTKTEDFAAQKKLIEETKEKIVLLDAHIITEDGVPAFLGYLESLGDIAGTKTEISSVAIREVVKGGNPELYLTVDSEGTYDAVYRYLALIEDLPYEIDIQTTSLRVSEEANEAEGTAPKWQLSVAFAVISFSQGE